MNKLKTILDKLNNELNVSLVINKQLKKKQTARSLQKYILLDKNNKKYLLEIATNSVEIFYLKRTIENQERFDKLKHNFKLNKPIYQQIGNKLSYVLYEYFDDIKFVKDDSPIEIFKQFYQENGIEIKLSDENIEKILSNFLSAWPNQYHAMIKRQKEFQAYKKELQRLETIKVCFEHGDFTSNNIFEVNNELYLMDFEFSRDFQPIGFDIYDYNISIKNKNNLNDTLHTKKYLLIEKINQKIDNNTNIEIYDNLDDDLLRENWSNLYEAGANYNLSYEWCKIWLKYFKQNKDDIFIFTIWDDKNLVFLAPLYKRNNTLYLIGSIPDLYDSFDVLCKDKKYHKVFFDFIFTNNYQINFRYLDSSKEISKNLIKYLYQNSIVYDSKVIDTKPKTDLNTLKIKTKEKSDIKRLKNRAIKNYDHELKFNFSIEKNKAVLEEFIKIHKQRWNGGPFKDIKYFEEFIKDISQTDLVVLSRLYFDKQTVAYHFGYKDSNNILNSAIPAYSNEFNDISPGKVLLYEIIDYCKDNDYKIFDFGRGAEEYKYWFSNESSILFHIKTQKNLIINIQNILNKILNRLNRIIYG